MNEHVLFSVEFMNSLEICFINLTADLALTANKPLPVK